ncbi:MAG: hypothetical protein U9O96_04220 [Candidatus Thermoplasmatota archaeon]|nr:hypothetical protein [Candidatus Thermoplasmatota archaeon]
MKDKKGEKYEFKMPKFDREEFIKKEKRKAKTSLISFGFGIVMGIICHFAWVSISPQLRWGLTFLLAICSIGFLGKLLQILKVDISKFGKKEWLGSISFYFFTGLAVFILSINPPFYDASPPKIDAVALPCVQEVGESVLIAAKITDNVGVKYAKANITAGSNWEIHDMQKDGNVYVCEYTGNESVTCNYTITASDRKGRESTYNGNFSFIHNAILVNYPSKKMDASDDIEIRVIKGISDENFRVYYTIDGEKVNATYSGEITIGNKKYKVYTTSPEYEGWKEKSSMNVSIFAEVIHYFVGVEKKYVNDVVGGTYTFNTTSDSSIGTVKSPPVENLPQPRPLQQVPGFELPALLVALAAVLLMKRRKVYNQGNI